MSQNRNQSSPSNSLKFSFAQRTLGRAILSLSLALATFAASCGTEQNTGSKSELSSAVTDGDLTMTMIALSSDKERIKLLPMVCKANAEIATKEDFKNSDKCLPGIVDQNNQTVSLDMHFSEFKQTFSFRGNAKSNSIRGYAAIPTFLGATGALEITRRSVKRQNRLGWTQGFKNYVRLPSIFMIAGTIIGGVTTFQVFTAPARTAGKYDRAIANHWEDLFENPTGAEQAAAEFAEAEKVEARSLMGKKSSVEVLRLLDRVIQDYELVRINPSIASLDPDSASQIRWLNNSQKNTEKEKKIMDAVAK